MNRLARPQRTLAAALIAVVAPAALAAVDVTVTAAAPLLHGAGSVPVEIVVTNNGGETVELLRRQLPSAPLHGALFRVMLDGRPVTYRGPQVKRAAPAPAGLLSLQPGQALQFSVDLAADFDLSANGLYAVEFDSPSGDGDRPSLHSPPLYLWLDGRSAGAPTAAPAPAAATCSATRQTVLQQALAAATGYASAASAYLQAPPAPTLRYGTWFGELSPDGWATAAAHFAATAQALAAQPVRFDCGCSESDVYAYVYPSRPYTIYLCGAFWDAPPTGTDSQAGTLVHEMTHFTAVAGTSDWAYGQSAARALAASNPRRALDNADNHEYFAENTPPLP